MTEDRQHNHRRRYRNCDDGGRELADYRPTQLAPGNAMRAREVATPSTEDLAQAAQDVVLVRRHFVPDGKLR